jgi:hypothetical protein
MVVLDPLAGIVVGTVAFGERVAGGAPREGGLTVAGQAAAGRGDLSTLDRGFTATAWVPRAR